MRRSGCSTSRRICAAKGSTWRSTIPPSVRARSCSGCWRRTARDAIGISVNLMTRANALAILGRRHGVRLEGGDGRSRAGELCGANIWMRARTWWSGEGELALEAILPRAARSSRLPRRDLPRGRMAPSCSTRRRAALPDLDAQPWPDRERIESSDTCKVWREHHGTGSVSVITARGCPYHCRWCSHSTFGKTHRRRSASAVVDEVEWILERYGPSMLWFADDVFTIHHGWMLE